MKKLYLLLGMMVSAGMLKAQTCPSTVSTFPYFQNFESGAGDWVADGVNSTWALGTPAKSAINSAASGTNAWVTNLTGQYVNNEKSQVTSPCFNFTSLVKPVISMKIWWKAETSWDGAVLQSSIDNGATWQNVGAQGDPNNWYNDGTINGNPGNQQIGWTGASLTSNPPTSGGWVLAKHELTGLALKPNVRLRIAFGSETSGIDDGFAFDDISVFDTPAADVGITGITSPVSGCGLSNQQSITVTIKNEGTAAQSNIPVSFTLNNGTPVTETFAGPLAPGATATYTFTAKANLSVAGTYAVKVCTGLAGDGNPGNDCTTSNVTSVPTVSAFPYIEGFENGAGGWTVGGTNPSWALGTPAKTVINSAGGGTKSWVTNLTGQYNASENSQVVGPCYNFSTLVKPVITMKIWWNSEAGWDGAVLQSSIDNGVTWQNVGAYQDPLNWYNDNSLDGRAGGQDIGWAGRLSSGNGSGGWVTAKHELNGLGGKPTVRLRIAFGSDGSVHDDGFAFDDINIFDTPQNETAVSAITAPTTACGLTNQQTVTATIKNLGLATQTTIPVTYTINNGTPVTENWTGTLAPGGTATFSFATKANLSTPGQYTIKVCTALGGDPDASNDCITVVVNSLPTISTFPYNQDFEGTAYTGWLASGTNSSWALGTPAKPVINSAGGGTKSWVTSLTGTYNANEQSAVVSPCLNFSTLQKPLMEMKVWWSAQTSFDGAVLQYSTDNGQNWLNVGSFGDGNNWYNDNSINAGPGGQPSGTTSTAEGWSGTGTASSGGWVTVKHALTGLQLRPNVRLRVAFGSDASTQNDGFAFDDVKIYDTPQNEMSVIGINNIASGCGLSSAQTITITVRNVGLAPQSNIPVTYSLDGVTFVPNEFIAGPVAPNATATYTFTVPANLSVAGVYTITACTRLPGDGDPTNDCRTITVRSVPTITSYPYFQDFETNDGGWVASGTNSTWALGTPNKPVIQGAASGTKAFVTSLTGSYNNSENSVVLGPCFNFSTLTNPQIDMKVWWMSEFSMDGAVLQSSTDNGVTWNNVGFNGDPNNWFNDGSINGAPGGQAAATAEGWTGHQAATASNGWVRARHSLSGLGGQANVKLRIAFGSNASVVNDGFAFDDILIYEKPTTDALVTSISSFNSGCGINNEQVTILIENAGTTPITSLPVSFQVTPQFGAPLNPVNETYNVAPIAPGAIVTYIFTNTANLSNPGINTITARTNLAGDQVPQNDATSVKQETLPTVTTYPYVQNFENGDGGWKASGTNSSWAFGTPAKAKIKGAASGVNAWVTSLTGIYNASENSRVLGPCFNFSTLVDPTIEMKIWWQAESSWDGAVLQSSIDGGVTWQNVGAMNDPNSTNWYNDGTINGNPGGQQVGWTGDTGTPAGSGGWVTAKHALTGLGGQSDVKLRIAFGSETSGQYDGFAFDDITILEASNNIAVTAFAPFTKICGFTNCEAVTVTIKNLSNTPITNFPVNLFLGTTQVGTQTVATLAANGTVDVTFPCVNLTATGQLTLRANAVLAVDPDQTNNTLTTTVTNSLFTTLPQGFSFEPGQKGLNDLRAVKGTQANITESTAASAPLPRTPNSTKGIVMDAVTGSPWTLPILTVDPWTNNLNNKSGVYMCLPAQPTAPGLWLMFDLKQTFKTASANTNFRVTVNGTMVGTTMRPPVDGTPDVFKTVKIDLSQYKNQSIQIGLESSTSEAYQNGAGTANLVDNIVVSMFDITATKDDILQGQLSVFPNPSNGQFNVNLPQGKAYELEVVDLTGRVLKRQSVKGGNSTLDLQGASQGIYLLKVKSENATAIRKLVIE